jgi:hypothetical protein
MVAINVINAVCRYLLGIVFTGADEVLVFMMIWLVMLGLILVTASRRNIALDDEIVRRHRHEDRGAGPRRQSGVRDTAITGRSEAAEMIVIRWHAFRFGTPWSLPQGR